MFGWSFTDGWWSNVNAFDGVVLVAFLALIAFSLRRHYLKRRRRASLQRDDSGTYVWVELDGSPGRSRDDPRDRWNAEDAAGSDGDGGGGGD